MRERGRMVQGFFPSQPRIVAAIAKLIRPAAEGNVSIIDAGCGEGAAIRQLKKEWGDPQNVKLYGVESDKGRADAAEKVLDEVIWGVIEDTRPSACCSLLWLNPSYDSVRGDGRMEALIFDQVTDWPRRKDGLLVLIVPAQVLKERWSELAIAVQRHYEVLGVWHYPRPEIEEYGQCVLIGHRRESEVKSWESPAWAEMQWPELPLDSPRARWTLAPSATVGLRRLEVSDEVLLEAVRRSPLQHGLLREMLAPEPPLARPPLALRPGHVSLLLAGGMETAIDDPKHGRFLVKGTLSVSNRKVGSEEKLDADGEPCAIVDRFRTTYELRVKALTEQGEVQTFTSEPPQVAEGENA